MDRIIFRYPRFVDHPQSKILNEASFPTFKKASEQGKVAINKLVLWLWLKKRGREVYPPSELSAWINPDLFYYDITRKMFMIFLLEIRKYDPLAFWENGFILALPAGILGELILRNCVDQYYRLSASYDLYDLPKNIYWFP